jgi:hypothetical protein
MLSISLDLPAGMDGMESGGGWYSCLWQPAIPLIVKRPVSIDRVTGRRAVVRRENFEKPNIFIGLC